jgi:hypothetical protein
MPGINSDDVRIPRHAREAVARHETVVVFNRERAVLVLVHPDDVGHRSSSHGRPVRAVAEALRSAPEPDPAFADDMADVLRSAGRAPESPWEHS